MGSNKLDFQSLSYNLENEFAKYKSDYPKDFGTAFPKYAKTFRASDST